MAQSGYIYILINPALSGLVKIGKTSKTSEERAKELSSATGVPTKFVVAYDEFFEDIDLAEISIHEILKSMGHHVFPNKEFFDIPLKNAIEIINKVKKEFSNSLKNNTELLNDIESEEEEDIDDEEKKPYYDALQEAKNYFFGLGDYLRDIQKAVEYFAKAGDLGSGEAYYELGNIANFGIGVKVNKKLALEFLKKGVKTNYLKSYLLMAQIYWELYQPDNSEKCINKFFEKIKNLNQNEKLNLLDDYLCNQLENNIKIDYIKLSPYRIDLINYYQNSIKFNLKRVEEYNGNGNEVLRNLNQTRIVEQEKIIDVLKNNEFFVMNSSIPQNL